MQGTDRFCHQLVGGLSACIHRVSHIPTWCAEDSVDAPYEFSSSSLVASLKKMPRTLEPASFLGEKRPLRRLRAVQERINEIHGSWYDPGNPAAWQETGFRSWTLLRYQENSSLNGNFVIRKASCWYHRSDPISVRTMRCVSEGPWANFD